jgi:hypothetical protein
MVLIGFGFVFTGCPTDTKEETEFEGTWRNRGMGWYGTYDLTYTFTGNNFVFLDRIKGDRFSGTFEFTETTITFNINDGTSKTQEYILGGNLLILDPDGETEYFTKQTS